MTLALAGPEGPLRVLVEAAGVAATRVVGYLGRETLPGVMRASRGLVFPSVYEGFGLPPLEALAMGLPVAAVRAGAVPEVVGDLAVLAESGEADDLSAAIDRMLGDQAYRDRVAVAGPARAATFSWRDHAEQVMAIYRRVADRQ